MNSRPPFFILGNPRSGTSLFRLMLNSHPEVVVPPECGFSEWLYDKYSEVEFHNGMYESVLRDVFNSRKFETWKMDFKSALSFVCKSKPGSYQDFVCDVYLAYANFMGKSPDSIVGDKNNYFINDVDRIDSIFPECKKIFIVRDGRDVACSYLDLGKKSITSDYKPKLANDIADISREWAQSVEIMRHWIERGAKSIKYEDLVMAPEKTLNKVCTFLGVEYSSEMLGYYKKNDEPEAFKAWKGRTFDPVSASSVGRYRHDLTEIQTKEFELNCGDYLEILGYKV